MMQRVLGIVVLLGIVGGGLFYYYQGGGSKGGGGGILPRKAKFTVKGYIGGEKVGFLADEEIQNLLLRKYQLKIDYTKAGSIEMVTDQVPADLDFLWPSNQVAVEIYKQRHNKSKVKNEIIFNSPIVFYSWDQVGDALVKKGLVSKRGDQYYVTKLRQLIKMIIDKKKWSDVGIGSLFGKMSIISTDPSKSNSGNMFAGLLANIIHGDVVDDQSIEPILPTIKKFFDSLGYLESSSGDLFEQYLRTGMGAKPIIVGYENQIVEFSLENPTMWPQVKDRVRILYPVPTVWSSHALIALNDRGKQLITALQDEEIQALAWSKHGFRSGMMGVNNDPKLLKIVGIPKDINQVMPMPTANVMDRIIRLIGDGA